MSRFALKADMNVPITNNVSFIPFVLFTPYFHFVRICSLRNVALAA